MGKNVFKMADNRLSWHLFEIELQTARQHGDRYFLRVSRGQNKFDMGWRFFKRFEHRVERMPRQHMNFVDHIDLEAPCCGRIHSLFEQLGHFLNTTIGRRIELEIVDKTTFIDFSARLTHPAGRGGDAFLAVECLSEDARQRGFAHPARTRKQPRVV